MYDFTANDLNEVASALKQDVLAPSASALKHKLQVWTFYSTYSTRLQLHIDIIYTFGER